jgi:ppGpp synthetase/RelA/SpoT-type nucleotidyltranferase
MPRGQTVVTDQQLAERRAEVLAWYDDARHRYLRAEELVGRMVRRALRDSGNDSAKIESRVKDPDSLADKAAKLRDDGTFKYADPRREITDYLGLRVLVPLRTEMASVTQLLEDLFVVVEKTDLREGMAEDVPGYQSTHLLVRLRPESLADHDFRGLGDPLFEIQARTILQHAWASLQHDLMYKTERRPGPEIRRRLIALAGLLELAEREFILVRHDHGESYPDPSQSPGSVGGPDHPLGPLVERLFGEHEPVHRAWLDAAEAVTGQLGLEDEAAVRAALGPWAGRADQVAGALRATEPWATPPYLLDALLRLALDEEYLSRRSGPDAVSDSTLSTFHRERDDLLARLDLGDT